MTKKFLNQNTKIDQEFIKMIKDDFNFSNKPINRFKNDFDNKSLKKDDKIKLLSHLKKQINSIENCNLKDNSKHFVMGEGDIHSQIMIIGEAPNKEEDEIGLPFLGESGLLLNKMLLAINLKRKNIYLTYSINFRTPEDRKPNTNEIARYSIFLKEHISIIDPKIIILLGSTAMESVIGSGDKISNERGKWKEIILKNKTFPVITTFSPSYLIRFPDNKKFSWEDLKKIRKKIKDLNITI